MDSITLTHLRRDLIDVINRIKTTGDSLVVTEYGRPVAVLSPPPSDAVSRKE